MAGLNDGLNPSSFSIQETNNVGDIELVESFLSGEAVTANPNDVTDVNQDEPKPSSKKLDPKKPQNQLDNKVNEEKEKKLKEIEDKKKLEEEEKTKLLKAVDDLLDDEGKKSDDKDEPDTLKDPDKSEEDGELSAFGKLSKDLFSLGVFQKEEGEEDVKIDTPEDFLERFNYEKRKGASEELERFIGQFGEPYQEAFQAIYVKGVDTKEY